MTERPVGEAPRTARQMLGQVLGRHHRQLIVSGTNCVACHQFSPTSTDLINAMEAAAAPPEPRKEAPEVADQLLTDLAHFFKDGPPLGHSRREAINYVLAAFDDGAAPPEPPRPDPDYPILVDGFGRRFVKVPIEDWADASALPLDVDPERLRRVRDWALLHAHMRDNGSIPSDILVILNGLSPSSGESDPPTCPDCHQSAYYIGMLHIRAQIARASSGESDRPRAINDHEQRCPDCQRVIAEEQRDFDRASSGESGSPSIEQDAHDGVWAPPGDEQ